MAPPGMTRRQAEQVCAATRAVRVAQKAAILCFMECNERREAIALVEQAASLQRAYQGCACVPEARALLVRARVLWCRVRMAMIGESPSAAAERVLCLGEYPLASAAVSIPTPRSAVVCRPNTKYLVASVLQAAAELHTMCACAQQAGVPAAELALLDAKVRGIQLAASVTGRDPPSPQLLDALEVAAQDIADSVVKHRDRA